MPRTLWPRRQHSFFVFGMFCVQILSGLYWLWLSLIFLSTCRQCRHSTSNEATTAYIYTHTHTHTHIYIYIYIYIYTGCSRRNVPDFGRVFLMLTYTDITKNTYIQSWMVTEIMAREMWGLLAVLNTATCTADTSRDSANVLDSGMQCSVCLRDALRSQPCYVTTGLSHV